MALDKPVKAILRIVVAPLLWEERGESVLAAKRRPSCGEVEIPSCLVAAMERHNECAGVAQSLRNARIHPQIARVRTKMRTLEHCYLFPAAPPSVLPRRQPGAAAAGRGPPAKLSSIKALKRDYNWSGTAMRNLNPSGANSTLTSAPICCANTRLSSNEPKPSRQGGGTARQYAREGRSKARIGGSLGRARRNRGQVPASAGARTRFADRAARS